MSNPEYGLVPISKSSWHSKVFTFGQGLWCNWWCVDDWDCERYVRHVDLCQYIRTIILKTPLVLATVIATYVVFFYTFLVFPFTYFPNAYWHFLGTLLIIFAGLAILGGITYFIAGIFAKRREAELEKYRNETSEEWLARMEAKRNRPPSFLKLFCQWTKDRHDRFCRLLEFKE